MESKLATWVDETVEVFGQPLALKLKPPPHGATREFAQRIREIRSPEVTNERLFEEYGDWIDQVFARWVRLPAPVEIDGERIESGKDLLGALNTALVLTIIAKLEKLIFLTAAEGKASASPSTPTVVAASETDGSSSLAPSTEPAAGPTP